MTDVVLVLNAGSSSIKFTLFDAAGDGPPLLLRGQIESLYTSPKFSRRRRTRRRHRLQVVGRWHATRSRGRADLPGRVSAQRTARAITWWPWATASCTAAPTTRGAVRVTPPVIADADQAHAAGAAASAAQPGAAADPGASCGPMCRRWRASTPRSIARSPRWRRRSRCRPRSPTRACVATAFTACRTSTSPACCRRSIRGPRRGARSSRTWATAAACARWWADAASRARWASRRSTGCRWARAAATSTPA